MYRIGRHSKSLDVKKKVCGRCGSRFELQINNASTRKNNSNNKKYNSENTRQSVPATPRQLNPFALYVKENYGSVKKQGQNLKHNDVMKALSEAFKKLKTKDSNNF